MTESENGSRAMNFKLTHYQIILQKAGRPLEEQEFVTIRDSITRDELRRRYPEGSGIPDQVMRPSPVVPFNPVEMEFTGPWVDAVGRRVVRNQRKRKMWAMNGIKKVGAIRKEKGK